MDCESVNRYKNHKVTSDTESRYLRLSAAYFRSTSSRYRASALINCKQSFGNATCFNSPFGLTFTIFIEHFRKLLISAKGHYGT